MAKDIFAKDKKKIERALQYSMQDLAEEAAGVLTRISPIQTGEYIRSFTAGITKQKLGNVPRKEPINTGHMSQTTKASLRESEKEKLARRLKGLVTRLPGKTISIGNIAGHALIVELLGWPKSPPYHTFSRAILYLEGRKKQICRKAVKRAFKI